MKHAITVVPSDLELCIKFGEGEEIIFEGEEFKVELPKNVGPATLMAVGYYIIGCIQEQHKQYFKENISKYIKEASSKPFGKGLSVIVE